MLALGSRPKGSPSPAWPSAPCRCTRPATPELVWVAVNRALDDATAATEPERQHRLATVVVGGGATGVELAKMLPADASRHGLAPDRRCGSSRRAPPSWPAPHPSWSTRPAESFLSLDAIEWDYRQSVSLPGSNYGSPGERRTLGRDRFDHVRRRLRLCDRTGADTHSQPV